MIPTLLCTGGSILFLNESQVGIEPPQALHLFPYTFQIGGGFNTRVHGVGGVRQFRYLPTSDTASCTF